MNKELTGRPYQFSRPYELSVSSSSLTVPFSHHYVAVIGAGYGSDHSQKDGQGVVKERQVHAYL